jgi:hypothetical protein
MNDKFLFWLLGMATCLMLIFVGIMIKYLKGINQQRKELERWVKAVKRKNGWIK